MKLVLLIFVLLLLFSVDTVNRLPEKPVRQELVPTASSRTLEPSTSVALRQVWQRILAAVRSEESSRLLPSPPVLIGPDRDEIARFNTMITAAKTRDWAISENEINAYA